MGLVRNKFSTISLKWEVELFPFSEKYPSSNDFGSSGSAVAAFISGSVPNNNKGSKIITGIKNMTFVRAKGQPDAKCSFTVLGRPPRECVPGTWVVISSYQNTAAPDQSNMTSEATVIGMTNDFAASAQVENRKPRFIGQITTMDTSYVADPTSGLISQTTAYHVREWSHALQVPVRLDLYAFAQTASTGIGQLTSVLPSNFVGPPAPNSQGVDAAKIAELVKKSLNPFEVAHLILTVVGAMQKNDAINSIPALGMDGFKEVAVKMPSVPKSLLDRLGLDADPKDAFTSGFLKVITGVQVAPALNDGQWGGVFGGGGALKFSDFEKKYNKSPQDRPSVMGAGSILQTGAPAWQLLNSFCDPSINEFFTDFVHELNDDGSIGARPVLFVRDKPFSLVNVEKNLLGSGNADKVKSFSKYDNLPRIRIPEANITQFRFNNSIMNSPNFIRVNFGDFSSNPDTARAQSNFRPPTRLDAEINRFGGNELDVQTNFLGYNDGNASPGAAGSPASLVSAATDVINNPPSPNDVFDTAAGAIVDVSEGFEFTKWVDKVKLIMQSWHSYDYRMGSGTLVLKDDNFSLTVGFNAIFRMGNYDLVGHIEAINVSVGVDGNGTYTTQTQLQLSRIVVSVNGNNAPLQFIDPASFNYLTEDPVNIGNLTAGEALSVGGGEIISDISGAAGALLS